jgi:Tfp pilus assembly protein PilF
MRATGVSRLGFLFLWAVVALDGPAAANSPDDGAAGAAAKPAAPLENDLHAAASKIREGRFDEALGLINDKMGAHPEWPPAQLILARLLFAANHVTRGRRALEQAAALVPGHPEVYLFFGGLDLSEQRLSDASLNFAKAHELAGSSRWNAERARRFRIEAISGLAAVAESREDWKGAAWQWNALLALDPKNGQVRQRLGCALFRLDKPDEAFAALRQGAKDTPALEPASISMGWLYSQKGDFKKASEWFDEALRLEPDSALVRLARATWLLEQGQAAAARTEIDLALKLEPKSQPVLKVRGLVAWHLRDLVKAEQIFEPLHRDAPADYLSANLLALALVEQNDEAKRSRGLQLAEVNAVQFPQSSEVLATLGWALYRAGRLDLAEEKLRAATSRGRATPDMIYFLAQAVAENGKPDEARKLLQSATAQRHAFAHRDDAAALLKRLTK